MFRLAVIGIFSLQLLAVFVHSSPAPKNAVCPPHETAFSREDLEDIFDDVNNDLHLNGTEFYYNLAKDFVREQTNRVNAFNRSFHEEPQKLKNVINHLSEVRKKLEPLVNKDASLLKNGSALREELKKKQSKLHQLHETFLDIKNHCKNSCPQNHNVGKRNVAEGDNEHYCGHLEDVENEIKYALEMHDSIFNVRLYSVVTRLNELFLEKIKEMEEHVEEAALNDYERLMHDVLKLQDDYNNYENLLNRVDVSALLVSVKESLLQADAKLFELHSDIEVYRKHCLECDSPLSIRVSAANRLQSLLYEVIEDKLQALDDEAVVHISNLYDSLDELIKEVEKEDTNPQNYKPAQAEVRALLEKEQKEFDHLQSLVNSTQLAELQNTDDNAKKLLGKIDDAISEVIHAN